MKRLFFSSMLIGAVFASCSKSSAPPHGQEATAFDIRFNVFVAANASTTTPSDPSTFQLSSVLSSANQNKSKYVSASSLSRAQSYIHFSGFTGTGASITNISFTTSDNGINSGILQDVYKKTLVISSDTTLTDDQYTTILGQIGDYMASKKNIALQVSYQAGGQNISNSVITLHLATTFSW